MSTLTVAHPNSRPSFRSWLRPRQLGLEIGDDEARMVVGREQASGYAVLRAGQLSLSTPFVEAPQIAAAEIAAWLRREGGAQLIVPHNLNRFASVRTMSNLETY